MGGDELFAGYDTRYVSADRRRWLGWMLPLRGAHADSSLIWRNRTLLQRLRRRASLARQPGFERYMTCHSRFRDSEKRALLQPSVLEETPAACAEFLRAAYDPSLTTPLEKRLRFEVMTLLPDEMLTKVDRATSAFGLEGRVPFLDRALAEYAWSLNPAVHWRAGQGKQVLRKTAEMVLPPEIVHRPKGGFSVPLSRWLREDKNFMRPFLLESMPQFDELVQPDAVRSMLAAHDSGKGEHGEHLWILYVLKSWLAADPLRECPQNNV